MARTRKGLSFFSNPHVLIILGAGIIAIFVTVFSMNEPQDIRPEAAGRRPDALPSEVRVSNEEALANLEIALRRVERASSRQNDAGELNTLVQQMMNKQREVEGLLATAQGTANFTDLLLRFHDILERQEAALTSAKNTASAQSQTAIDLALGHTRQTLELVSEMLGIEK